MTADESLWGTACVREAIGHPTTPRFPRDGSRKSSHRYLVPWHLVLSIFEQHLALGGSLPARANLQAEVACCLLVNVFHGPGSDGTLQCVGNDMRWTGCEGRG